MAEDELSNRPANFGKIELAVISMKNKALQLVATLCVAILFSAMGCGSGSDFAMVPVSGTITMDGKPLTGVQVNFFPLPTEESNIVGPFSSAITDEMGNYTLINRYGDRGAVVGRHKVSVKLEGVDMEVLAGAEQEFRELMEDARDGDEVAKSELPEAKEMLAKLRKSKSKNGIVIPARYSLNSELIGVVPAGGTDEADFDLSSN